MKLDTLPDRTGGDLFEQTREDWNFRERFVVSRRGLSPG
jgi:hypothetical protein